MTTRRLVQGQYFRGVDAFTGQDPRAESFREGEIAREHGATSRGVPLKPQCVPEFVERGSGKLGVGQLPRLAASVGWRLQR